MKKTNHKIGHKIAQTALKKASKRTLGRFMGKFFVPGSVNAYDKAEQIYESESNIKKRIKFDIKNNNNEKTFGFAIHFPSDKEIEIYEIIKK
ncbi:hypothetical protein [Italian clover phyllody phytoplasma]|uniref:hypothetical protein n=1 Tax=Italian clover phyllody phytoplasma TaxID=1196420 RepID=UPI0002EC9C53|nr:hypothetical protein [Italian clover phyllody phytoplasma]